MRRIISDGFVRADQLRAGDNILINDHLEVIKKVEPVASPISDAPELRIHLVPSGFLQPQIFELFEMAKLGHAIE